MAAQASAGVTFFVTNGGGNLTKFPHESQVHFSTR